MATSAAVPSRLVAFGDASASVDERLAAAAGPLGEAIAALTASNSEGVGGVPPFDVALRVHAGRGSLLGSWVTRVGLAFARADGAGGGIPTTAVTADDTVLDELIRQGALDADGDGVLTPAEQLLLARAYAPILYFHPGERNFLGDPMQFIQSSSLRRERDFWPDEELFPEGGVDPFALPGITSRDTFLDAPDGDEREGDNALAPILYQYDPATNTITHWLFYPYNDGPGPQNHEGDWEQITIQLDRRFYPTEVRYSGHGTATTRSWPEAPTEAGRPKVFVARGSHANYPEPGRWPTAVPGIFDDAAEGTERLDTRDNRMADVTRQPWYGSGMGWGERGSVAEIGVGDTSGPTGPSADKGPMTDGERKEPVRLPPLPTYGPLVPPLLPR